MAKTIAGRKEATMIQNVARKKVEAKLEAKLKDLYKHINRIYERLQDLEQHSVQVMRAIRRMHKGER